MNWQPDASLPMLSLRAHIYHQIRSFFADKQVLEVDTPLLAASTVSDPNLDSFAINNTGAAGYLQTSPEYFMKRLLAAGVGDIYSLSKAFRPDESGRYHNREFTLLEWYRTGFDDRALARELVDLIARLSPDVEPHFATYGELFEAACGINPHGASVAALRSLGQQMLGVDWQDEHKSVWLDLLFTHKVEPTMGERLQVVWDYPVCQSALARVDTDDRGQAVARRFEIYWQGIELANGYWELTDADEQRRRFEEDNALRVQLGRATVLPDEHLLAALEHGLPGCAGVALGVDRLLMCLSGAPSISQVISFR